jgi:hypothetical protein
VEENVENALYYTLSTISQTLAAAIGLLAAFLILRLGSLDRQLDEHFHELRYADDPDLHEARGRRDFARVLSLVSEHEAQLTHAGRRYHFPAARNLVALRSKLVVSLRNYLLATALVIVVAVVGLAWAPEIASNRAGARALLVVEIFGVLLCFYGYVRLIIKALA